MNKIYYYNISHLTISKNWIPVQKLINADNKIHLLKTHNALCSINNNNFTNKENSLAAIYIVRDPRNIITSISNHFDLNIDESFKFLTNKKKIIFPIDNKNSTPDFNFLSDYIFRSAKFSSSFYILIHVFHFC